MATQIWSSPKLLCYNNYNILFDPTEVSNMGNYIKYIHEDPSDDTSAIVGIQDALGGSLFNVQIDSENSKLKVTEYYTSEQYSVINCGNGFADFKTYMKYRITAKYGLFMFSKTSDFATYRLIYITGDYVSGNIGFETVEDSTLSANNRSKIQRAISENAEISILASDIIDRCYLNDNGVTQYYLFSNIYVGATAFNYLYTVDGGNNSLPLLNPFSNPNVGGSIYLPIHSHIVARIDVT